MARRPARAAIAVEPVTWRDGVHVTGTPIWCDARRARDLCFVSSADRVGRAGHGQLIATAETLAQLGAAGGAHLSVPYHRPFTLGTLRLELVPSGHGRGGAALLVDTGERRVLCAGVVAHDGEVRRCDVLVIDAPYAQPRHAFPADAADAAIDACRRAIAGGEVPALLVTSPGKGLEVAARLVDAGLAVRAHRSIHHAARRLAAAGVRVPDVRRAATPAQVGATDAVLWPVRERARLGDPRFRRILVSGLATEPETVAALGVDAAFAWSDAADRATLVKLVASTGAERVYLTGRHAEAAAEAIGDRARVLAPPRQMALFEESA